MLKFEEWWNILEKLDNGALYMAAKILRFFEYSDLCQYIECCLRMIHQKNVDTRYLRFCWLLFESGIPCICVDTNGIVRLLRYSRLYAGITKKDEFDIVSCMVRNIYSYKISSAAIFPRHFKCINEMRPIEIMHGNEIKIRFSEHIRHAFLGNNVAYRKMLFALMVDFNVYKFLQLAYEFLKPGEVLEFDELNIVPRRITHNCILTERTPFSRKVVVHGVFRIPDCKCTLNEFTFFVDGIRYEDTSKFQIHGKLPKCVVLDNIKTLRIDALTKSTNNLPNLIDLRNLSVLDIMIFNETFFAEYVSALPLGCQVILRASAYCTRKAVERAIDIIHALPKNLECFRMINLCVSSISPKMESDIYTSLFYDYKRIGIVVFGGEFGVIFWNQYLDAILLRAQESPHSSPVQSIELIEFAKQASPKVITKMNLHNSAKRLPRLIY